MSSQESVGESRVSHPALRSTTNNNAEGTNPKVVNGQRIKHYISGTPINVETNVIDTVTPKEYIRDTFQNVSDSKKE